METLSFTDEFSIVQKSGYVLYSNVQLHVIELHFIQSSYGFACSVVYSKGNYKMKEKEISRVDRKGRRNIRVIKIKCMFTINCRHYEIHKLMNKSG